MKKIPPSEGIRKEIEGLLQEGTTDNLLGRVLHEGMRRKRRSFWSAVTMSVVAAEIFADTVTDMNRGR